MNTELKFKFIKEREKMIVFIQRIKAVDSHTMGEPTRVITGGMPEILGETMSQKKEYLQQNLDYLRRALMLEPRGHRNMFGSIITETNNRAADFGVIFMDAGGYLNMCGHGSIGTMTVAIELGLVEVIEPETTITMDTPAGLVKGRIKVEKGRAKEVSIVNVPSFLYKKDLLIETPNLGEIRLDIAFGGSFFAIVHAKSLGIRLKKKNRQKLIRYGLEIRETINKTIKVQHPDLKHINTVDLVEIYDNPIHKDADYKNVVIFGSGQMDRSPCGTGTCAKIATLYAKGELKEGQVFTYESITGTLFQGKVVGETKVGDFDAVIPEITGQAFITGFNEYVIDEDDPLKYGVII